MFRHSSLTCGSLEHLTIARLASPTCPASTRHLWSLISITATSSQAMAVHPSTANTPQGIPLLGWILMPLVTSRFPLAPLSASVETDSGFPPIPLHTIFDKFDQPQVFSGADDLAELKANGGKLPRTLGISIIAAQHMASLALQVSAPDPPKPSNNAAATAGDAASPPQGDSNGAAAGPGSSPGPGSAGSTPVSGSAGSTPVPGPSGSSPAAQQPGLSMASASKPPAPPPKPPNPLGLTYTEITAMASQLMDEAGKRRKEVMAEVRCVV